MVVAAIPSVDARVAAVEDEDNDAVGGAGGEGGFAYSSVHCLAVLSCWARLRMNFVVMIETSVDLD